MRRWLLGTALTLLAFAALAGAGLALRLHDRPSPAAVQELRLDAAPRAGFEPGALRGVRADLALLGIGLLGTRERAFAEDYWRETVRAVGARRVIPIHWDDFTRLCDEPLRPMPRLLDDFPAALRWLSERADDDGGELRFVAERRPFAMLPMQAALPRPHGER